MKPDEFANKKLNYNTPPQFNEIFYLLIFKHP